MGEAQRVRASFGSQPTLLRGPLSLVVATWFWVAAEAGHPEEKQRCLDAVSEMGPDNTRTLLALAAL